VIERTTDPELVNRLVGEGDYTEFLAEPLHVCLIDGESGAMFAWRGPGIYEAHIFFKARGKEAFSLARALLARMMLEHDAKLFWTMIPEADRKAKLFLRHLGWRSLGMRETRHGPNELFVQGNA